MFKERTLPVKTVWKNIVDVIYRTETNDAGIIRSVMIYDEYKTKLFEYDDRDIFIDLGAHIGTWSLLMASLNPTFDIYSYEAIPENFTLLRRNIELNGFKNIHPFMNAVSGDSEGMASIYYTNDDTPFGKAHKFVGNMLEGPGKVIQVPKISINDIFEKNNIETCKMIKMDCEGCEVKGFLTLEEKHMKKIEYIVGEFHPFQGIDVSAFYSLFEPYFEDISHLILNEENVNSLRRILYRRK